MLHSVLQSSLCRWWAVGFLGSSRLLSILFSLFIVCVCAELKQHSEPKVSLSLFF